MIDPKALLTTSGLAMGYLSGKDNKVVAQNLNLSLYEGQLVCLLGPNGSGKSTLMRTIAGLQPALDGEVHIGTTALASLKPSELACKLSLVLTEKIEAGNLTVNDVVSLGRTPYTGWLGKLTAVDDEKIAWAIAVTGISDFKQKRIHQLSDGERQKVMLARALAQDTDIILLDEPTAHLDLPSRVEMMHLLHSLARRTRKAILLSTHELDLALQAADELWLMKQNGELTTGVPEDLVLNGAFEATFSKPGFYFDKSTGSFTIHQHKPSVAIHLSGQPNLVFWTKRALWREGIGTDASASSSFKVVATDTFSWSLNCNGIVTNHLTLAELINTLKLSLPDFE